MSTFNETEAVVKSAKSTLEQVNRFGVFSHNSKSRSLFTRVHKDMTAMLEEIEVLYSYKLRYEQAVKAVWWMHDDKTLGLKLGDNLLIEGVAKLKAARDIAENKYQWNKNRRSSAKEHALRQAAELREQVKRLETQLADNSS